MRQETVYDGAGRIILIREQDPQNRLLWAEGYVYDGAGRRSHSVDEDGNVTAYEYDAQSRLQTVLYPWTEEQADADKREAEEAGLYFTVDKGVGERYSYSGEEVKALRDVLNLAGPSRGNSVRASQMVWRESYAYDTNGNRIGKTTPWGTIAYTYDKENRLITKGTIHYVHDADGNLLSETGLRKEAAYRYGGRNRVEEAVIQDTASGERVTSRYRYDALGLRTTDTGRGRGNDTDAVRRDKFREDP